MRSTPCSGTLDIDEVLKCFKHLKIRTNQDAVLEMMATATGVSAETAAASPGDLEVDYEQFAAWMQSSSPLADKLRQKLGGTLDDAFNIDDLGIEEREQYTGWVYEFPGDTACTIFVLLEEPESSKLAKLLSSYVLLLILFSSVTFVMESVSAVRASSAATQFIAVSEVICIINFTIEYIGRAATCTHRPYSQRGFFAYVLAPMNLIDAVSIMPFYLELMLGAGGNLAVLRVLRMARIFRIFKVGGYAKNLSVVVRALERASTGLSLMLYLVTIFVVVMSSIIYSAQRT
eukprot:SAG31_NODE_314_length_17854_cov_3.932075_4_plen_289_part_00